jgi:hypothetical protein
MSGNLPATPMTGDTIHENAMPAFPYDQGSGNLTSPTTLHKRKSSYPEDEKSGGRAHQSITVHQSPSDKAEHPKEKSWIHEKWDNFTAPIHTRWNRAIESNSIWPRVIYCVVGLFLAGVWSGVV